MYRLCLWCSEEMPVMDSGRPRKYCSNSCKYKWTYHNNKGYRDNQIVKALEDYYEDKEEKNKKRYENMKNPTGRKNKKVAEPVQRKIWDKPLDPEIEELSKSPYTIWSPTPGSEKQGGGT